MSCWTSQISVELTKNTRLGTKLALAALAIIEVGAIQLAHPHDGVEGELGICECVGDNGVTAYDGEITIFYKDVTYKYDAAYGSSCAAWDTSIEPYCADN